MQAKSLALATVVVFMVCRGGAKGEYTPTEACSVRYSCMALNTCVHAMIGVEGGVVHVERRSVQLNMLQSRDRETTLHS